MYLNSNYSYIIEHLGKKIKIEERFNTWLTIKKDYYNSMTIAPRELNERYKLLSKPFDTYCKQNYIDYNFIVDQILQMSLPYSEGKGHDKVLASQEQSLYEPSIHYIKQAYTGSDGVGNVSSALKAESQAQSAAAQFYNQKQDIMSSQGMNLNMNMNMNNHNNNNLNFFSIPNSLDNANLKISNAAQIIKPVETITGIKPIVDNTNLNMIGNPLVNQMSLGRIDSFNNFLRDGSFYNWENNNDRFLFSRGPSQLFPQLNEDFQDESKNLFSKNNAFKNISTQSLGW